MADHMRGFIMGAANWLDFQLLNLLCMKVSDLRLHCERDFEVLLVELVDFASTRYTSLTA